MLTANSNKFDPTRDGFGFRNPVGKVANRTGGGSLLRRFGTFLYGRGLCFGMSTVALLYFADRATDMRRPQLAELPLTPTLLSTLRKYHLRQFWPRAVFATVCDWIVSGG